MSQPIKINKLTIYCAIMKPEKASGKTPESRQNRPKKKSERDEIEDEESIQNMAIDKKRRQRNSPSCESTNVHIGCEDEATPPLQ